MASSRPRAALLRLLRQLTAGGAARSADLATVARVTAPTVELELAAPPSLTGDEPFRGAIAPAAPDHIAASWTALDPARHDTAVRAVGIGAAIAVLGSLVVLLHPFLVALPVVLALAIIVWGTYGQNVAQRLEADDEWLRVEGLEERRLYLPEVARLDTERGPRCVQLVAHLTAGPPVLLGTFADAGAASAVLWPLHAHWQRTREQRTGGPPAPTSSTLAVRRPLGLRARPRKGALVVGRRWYWPSRRLLWSAATVAFAGLCIANGSPILATYFGLLGLTSLVRALRSTWPTITAERDGDTLILRGGTLTLRVARQRLAALAVDAAGTIRAVLRSGSSIVLPPAASPGDAPYTAVQLGAALGVPVAAPALPAGAVGALPAGEPDGAA
jgi:hypothetical protein